MCVGNIVCIIYTNDIEAEKPFEIGSYHGMAPPYNEFVDVINSICKYVTVYCIVQNKTLKKNHVLSIESIFSKEIGGPKKGRWGSPEKGCFYWDAAISASQSSSCG
jgi:hypothetical protein